MKDKKKFSETKLGIFLKEKAPNVVDAIGDVFPPAKILSALIGGSSLSPEDKAKAQEHLIEYEKELTARQLSEDTNVTERWKADAMSDSWLSKNSRPLTLLSLLGFMFLIILTDSIEVVAFQVKEGYIDLISTILSMVVLAYFGGRTSEKIFKKK